MSKKQFGYIGSTPTQSFASLSSKYNPIKADIPVQVFVVGGGGGGSASGAGGGGGGSSMTPTNNGYTANGGTGGSGIVIIRYKFQ